MMRRHRESGRCWSSSTIDPAGSRHRELPAGEEPCRLHPALAGDHDTCAGRQTGQLGEVHDTQRNTLVSRFGWMVDYPMDEHHPDRSGGVREKQTEVGPVTLCLGPSDQPADLHGAEEWVWRFATVVGDRTHLEDNDEMEQIRTGLGLSGIPAYTVLAVVGEVVDTRLVLHLRARDHGWRGQVCRAVLPIALPVMIDGLNERWSSGVWYPGRNTHLIPEWKAPCYTGAWYPEVEQRRRTRTDDIQGFGVPEGRGYLQLDTEGGDWDVFVGNLAVCDDAELHLTLIVEDRSARIMVHNPTAC
jgi:hypothetical protein